MQLNFFNQTIKRCNPVSVKKKIIILISIFVIGFIILITSNSWLVTKNDFKSNKIYDTISVSNDISLKLRRWTYNPSTKQTEIEIGKNFSSVNNDLKFSLNVLGNGTTFIKAKIDYDSPNLWIISLPRLPINTKYVKLNFTVNIDNSLYGSSFTMDLKSPQINIDNNLKLHKTEKEYITQSLSYEKQRLEQNLIDNNDIIKHSQSNIEKYKKELEDLQGNTSANYTKDEMQVLNQKINNLNEEINKLTDLIEDKSQENKTLQNDINVLNDKLSEK